MAKTENLLEWGKRVDGAFDRMRKISAAYKDGQRHRQEGAAYSPPEDAQLRAAYARGFSREPAEE